VDSRASVRKIKFYRHGKVGQGDGVFRVRFVNFNHRLSEELSMQLKSSLTIRIASLGLSLDSMATLTLSPL
jgi:hypothetical protein